MIKYAYEISEQAKQAINLENTINGEEFEQWLKEPSEGYFELFTYKFKNYLGSVGRRIRNKQLAKRPYRG